MDETWIPDSCTLPTSERPLRLNEFDELFAHSVRGVERLTPERARFTLDRSPETAARAAHLAVRESACCLFFTFTLRASGDGLTMDVDVPPSQTSALDALTGQASQPA